MKESLRKSPAKRFLRFTRRLSARTPAAPARNHPRLTRADMLRLPACRT